MWPFSKPAASRAQRIRRSKAERRSSWLRRVSGPIMTWTFLITLATAAAAAAILNLHGEVLSFRVGMRVPRAITARIDFTIADPQRTTELQLRARDSSPNYYKLNVQLLNSIRDRLNHALVLAGAHAGDAEQLKLDARSNDGVILDDAGAAELLRLASQNDSQTYQDIVDALIAVLRGKPLVESNEQAQRRSARSAKLFDPDTSQDQNHEMVDLLFASPETLARVVDETVVHVPTPLRASLRTSLIAMLTIDPTTARALYDYDHERTSQASDLAYSQVPPQVLKYSAGNVLADAGALDAAEIELLTEEHLAYEHSRPEFDRDWWLAVGGRSVLAFVIVFGVAIYLARVQRSAFRNVVNHAISTFAMLALLLVTRWAFAVGDAPPHLAVGAQALAAALLGVVFPRQVIFVICSGLAVLMTLAVQQSVAFCVILITVSGILVFGLRQVRYRGKIVLVGGCAAVAALILSCAVGLLEGQALRYVLHESIWAAGLTFLAAVIVEAVLPGIERVFGLATAMTLLEWCDASKPLLRMMAAEAPGTYNHSLLVGVLAEAGAESIGANGLLARAGSYYHDIGKINKPEYFIENQAIGVSRHEGLSPAMSLLVIIGHVKDGVEMAREYALPRSLRAFIAEHHGTTLVEYFYHAATQKRRPDEPAVSESEFRYPGPKPQSRETAIVMLCDAVEGAARAMPEPNPNRIETVVADIARKRLVDGQFDDCDLTFKDLATIERTLVKTLCGIYHARIAYPDRDEPASSEPKRHAS